MNTTSFSVILLPTLHCDARCDYCFEDTTTGIMELDSFSVLLEKLFDFMEIRNISLLNIYWQGGEIFTLSPDWVYAADAQMKSIAKRRGRSLINYLQSNLLSYSDKWEPVVRDVFGGSIGTSMDFPNNHRRMPGRPAEEYTERWMKNVHDVLAAGFTVGVIAVPSVETLDLGARPFYDFFTKEAGIDDFQVNPPFPGGAMNEAKRKLPLDPCRFGDFLVELSDIWFEQGFRNGVRVSPMSEILDYFLHGDTVVPCFWQANCANNFICVDPRGNVSQCDCWVASYPEMHFGNIFSAPSLDNLLKESKARHQFLTRPGSLMAIHDCADCEHLAFCHGGCPVRAYSTSNTLQEKDPYCKSYKLLFSHLKEAAGRIASSHA
ncbi:MAG: radical SAM protein [Desulforhopalus sp.]